MVIFTTFTSTNCTGVSHETNTSGCRNSTVSPKLVASPTCHAERTWAGGPLALHSWSETTPTHKMAFLGISMHFFKKYITSMSGMWFLLFVQSLFQFGAKEGKWLAITEKKLSWHVLNFCISSMPRLQRKRKHNIFIENLKRKFCSCNETTK